MATWSLRKFAGAYAEFAFGVVNMVTQRSKGMSNVEAVSVPVVGSGPRHSPAFASE